MLERPPPTNVQSHEWLLREQLRLRAILDTSHEAGVGMDADGRITDWNRQAEVLLGWSASEAMGQLLAGLIIPPRYHAAHHAGMAHYQATGGGPYIDRQMEVQALHREGHEVSVEMMLTVLHSGNDYTFFAFLQDVAERKAAEQALLEQAMQDPLTGLDNRRAFMAHLSDAMRRTQRSKRPMALLYMDIDHFKSINDGLGHGVGDLLLKAFGARLKAQVRVVDRVARLGGDVTVEGGTAISGYASLFGARDQGGDVVDKGAYAASLARLALAGGRVKMLWQHDASEPIGVWDEVHEDARGLFVKGRILTDVARGREAAALIGAGAIDGLSIGYRTVRATKDTGGLRHLNELDLWEVSLVTFPMLPQARVAAKGDDPEAAMLRTLATAFRAARQSMGPT